MCPGSKRLGPKAMAHAEGFNRSLSPKLRDPPGNLFKLLIPTFFFTFVGADCFKLENVVQTLNGQEKPVAAGLHQEGCVGCTLWKPSKLDNIKSLRRGHESSFVVLDTHQSKPKFNCSPATGVLSVGSCIVIRLFAPQPPAQQFQKVALNQMIFLGRRSFHHPKRGQNGLMSPRNLPEGPFPLNF